MKIVFPSISYHFLASYYALLLEIRAQQFVSAACLIHYSKKLFMIETLLVLLKKSLLILIGIYHLSLYNLKKHLMKKSETIKK